MMIAGPARFVALGLIATQLGGCVAAIPVIAAGIMADAVVDGRKARKRLLARGAIDGTVTLEMPQQGATARVASPTQGAEFAGAGRMSISETGRGGVVLPPGSTLPPPNLDSSPYGAFAGFALGQAAIMSGGEGVRSAVLVPQVEVEKPATMGCSGKPPAVLIDLDDKSGGMWVDGSAIAVSPGLPDAVARLRAGGIVVIWLSDAGVAKAADVAAVLSSAGLYSSANDFLFLNRKQKDRKQLRRWDAAGSYCIVAAAGDARQDFDELYAYLKDPDVPLGTDRLFGQGWFLAPPPVAVAAPARKGTGL